MSVAIHSFDMQSISSSGGHSSRVEMRLVLLGAALRVAQLGPDYLLLEQPIDHPPTEAEFLFSVDAAQRQWRVSLPEGISKCSKRVAMQPISESVLAEK